MARGNWVLSLSDDIFHRSPGCVCTTSGSVRQILQFERFFNFLKLWGVWDEISIIRDCYNRYIPDCSRVEGILEHKALGSWAFSAVVGRLLATHIVTTTTSTNTVVPDDDEGWKMAAGK